MASKIAVLLGCILVSSAAFAMDVYQWVDENGRTQISDQVPARYKGVAKKIDTSPSELTESQRREALARAAREKQQAEAAAAKLKADAAKAPEKKTAKESKPAASNSDDCEKLMRAYRESQECFAPYMRQQGGTREEAYKYCTPVADPSGKCGLPSY